jgi:hypothetical protein
MSYSASTPYINNPGNLVVAPLNSAANLLGGPSCVLQQQNQIFGGLNGCISLGGGYLDAGEMDLMSTLTHALMKDFTNAKKQPKDAIYPFALDLAVYASRFHLLTWRESDPDRIKNFWQIIEINPPMVQSYNIERRLTFLNRADRTEFKRWWTTYTNRFFGGITPFHDFLPYIKPGKVNGVFIEHKTMLDHLPYDYAINPTIVSNLCRGLIEALPAWAWISAHCRKPVYRVSGGWLFTSGAEAAKFVMFDGSKTLPKE